ncbi:hypothetical protein SAMN05192561_103109 [Halopenitus malekzadehii]|uniref:Uncharacterized protein n=2 Tax=Halopenitus malekzadehii TaxID=1267564 RepID=A0A1H6IM19_9EURY|nr:hypothetical protein SAMN05192561_103109 [Halopenitus malekzadehii]
MAGGAAAISDMRRHELEKVARKNKGTVMLVSFILPWAGYLMIDETVFAALSFLSGHYFLLGHLIVPFHAKAIIDNARQELDQAGATW